MPRPSYSQSSARKLTLVKEVRKERLALNLFDVLKVYPAIREMLLKDKLDLSNAVWVDKTRLDETAAVFTCDLLTAACCCDVLRSEQRKVNDPPVRVYIRRAEVWSRVPYAAILTVIEDGVTALNPDWFPRDSKPLDFPVPEFELPKFGGG